MTDLGWTQPHRFDENVFLPSRSIGRRVASFERLWLALPTLELTRAPLSMNCRYHAFLDVSFRPRLLLIRSLSSALTLCRLRFSSWLLTRGRLFAPVSDNILDISLDSSANSFLFVLLSSSRHRSQCVASSSRRVSPPSCSSHLLDFFSHSSPLKAGTLISSRVRRTESTFFFSFSSSST